MSEQNIRQTIVYGNYFWEFYHSQTIEVQGKIDWVIGLVRSLQFVPERFLKHLEGTDGLYEMRIQFGSNVYRIFCCFDKGKLVILLNGFQKKTAKTPQKEIEKAKKLKQQYYESKNEQ